MIVYKSNEESFAKLARKPYQLVFIMACAVIIISTLLVYMLYEVGMKQQEMRLEETVKSRASMIQVIADNIVRFHSGLEVSGDQGSVRQDVLNKLIYAHERFMGFGETGEFTLAQREGSQIAFLLRHRHDTMFPSEKIPFDSKLAEPMRRALGGESGTIVGLDYRGVRVLAAYQPIKELGWGIVAKIDIDEIRHPYIEALIYVFFAALGLIFIGALLVLRVMHPLLEEIQNSWSDNIKLFNKSPIGLVLCDMQGKVIDANLAFAVITGYDLQELSEMDYWQLTPEKYMENEQKQLDSLEKTGAYGPYEKEYRHKSGKLVNVRLSGRIIRRKGIPYIWSSVEDISKKKSYEEQLKQASLVFENTHEGIMVTDRHNQIIRINSTFSKITGYSEDEVIGNMPSILKSERHDNSFYAQLWHTLMKEGKWYGEIWNRRKDGSLFPALQSISIVKDGNDRISGYVSVFSDITELKAYQEKLEHLASHDKLTSLPNRMYFENNLEQSIHMAKRRDEKMAILFLDLNRFKEVNDSLGHKVGDQVLQLFAKRVQSSIREEDTVARLGGDEFAVILPEIERDEDAVKVAKKIIAAVEAEEEIDGHMMSLSSSIGISLFPDHGTQMDELLTAADAAMYFAKKEQNGGYAYYDPTTMSKNQTKRSSD